jgi:Holliday junction resolvase RusA-like endonuclease
MSRNEIYFYFFRQLIDDVVNGRENTKLAQQKLQQYKADFVKQYKEELKQLMKQALEDVRIKMKDEFQVMFYFY